jgi:hypothetical protein
MILLGGVSIIYNMNTTRIRAGIIYNILLDRSHIIYNEHY